MGTTLYPQRLRGAIPTPRAKLMAAFPHQIVGDTPAQFFWKFNKLSYWLNNQYGDCVSAEEAFNISVAGDFVSDQTVYNFAKKHGYLNGAMLTDVMDDMISDGMHEGSNSYSVGHYTAVDYTNAAALQNAISKGVVKIAVAANQLERAVNTRQGNGWYGTNFRRDGNIDHCTALSGYGPMGWLFQQLGVTTPSVIDGNAPGYSFFTWSSVGVVDTSITNIMGEAWLRQPSSVRTPPYPNPQPEPPTPPPLPTPSGANATIYVVIGGKTYTGTTVLH